MPEANTLTIGIFATLAQYEREMISERTRAALAAKKAQGFMLGSPQNLTDASRKKAAFVRRTQAREHIANIRALAFATRCRTQGLSLRAIAKELNENGFMTTRSGVWSFGTVRVLLQRKPSVEQVSEFLS
jgi:DNA invertase Pin-like site-specific DNA recombinase